MKKILFISHRMPYPPNKGDKIRAYSIIRCLKNIGYSVSLAFTVDDPDDLRHIEFLDNQYDHILYENKNRYISILRTFFSLFTTSPLSITYFYIGSLRKKIKKIFKKQKFDIVFYYSGASLNYFIEDENIRNIIDYVDVDSLKWRAYGQDYHFPLNLFYKMEAKKLKYFEKKFLNKSDHALLVSSQEVDLFKENCGIDDQNDTSQKEKVIPLENIVDIDYFSPDHIYRDPYQDIFDNNIRYICVFTGQMDYNPNIDAVLFFAKEILPLINEEMGNKVGFVIAGRNPNNTVQALDKDKNIHITGSVEDIRPFILHADISVCPLMIARGIQNKILEAMACKKPVICSPEAFEGINANNKEDLFIAKSIKDWVFYARELLLNINLAQRTGDNARQAILKNYSSEKMETKLKEILHSSLK